MFVVKMRRESSWIKIAGAVGRTVPRTRANALIPENPIKGPYSGTAGSPRIFIRFSTHDFRAENSNVQRHVGVIQRSR